MPRLSFLLLTFFVSVAVRGEDRFIPVFTGNISDRTFRTTVDLRSATTEECRFDLRAPDGKMFHSVVSVAAGKPMLLDQFAAEFRTFATAVKVSCSGSVDVHSRIHESADGGVTYADGSLFRAVVPEPLTVDQPNKLPITSDFIVAEVHGAPARVTGTLTYTASNYVTYKKWDLPPFGEHALLVTEALLSLGPAEADLQVAGEGQVIFIPAITDPAFVKFASRAPDPVRAQLDAQVRAAVAPPPASAPPIARQLVASSFKAAPFQEPMTGLVFMRDRWYDPKTGSFMTPDPEGYRDSSNLYSFCGGDPVNCSDPTGRAASVNRKGDIIGIRPNGSRYFISSAQAKADPVWALRLLESDSDLGFDEQEDIMRRATLPIPVSSACRPGENCLSYKRTNPNAFTHLPSDGKWVEAAFIGTTGLPPRTREQQLMSGGVQILSTAVPAAAGVRARARGGVGPGIQPYFNTRADVPVGVNTFMMEAYGPPLPPKPQPGVSPFDQYKRDLAMDMGKPIVSDPELAGIMDKLYRPGATLWSGSTADAVRYERMNGQQVGSAWHSQKAQEEMGKLLSWMNRHPEMSSDRAAAEQVYYDLKQALTTPDVRTKN